MGRQIINDSKLILKLAKNDFKTRFAGSYFGTIWAFVQPVVTILVYWFVFEKALGAAGEVTRTGVNAPFVIWLMAGLVPWFFFQEAMSTGTRALLDYEYLVKKVVFRIEVLPIVKLLSSLFVHLFFLAIAVIICTIYGLYPDWYTLQLFYYGFCMIVFSLAIVYITSSIVVFFRDVAQIVNIVLQIGIWATPIMWNIASEDMQQRIPSAIMTILKLNPMYYIVNGYRDALIYKEVFWDSPGLTIYFWVMSLMLLLLGTTIFRRLRIHFADVL